MEEQPAAGGETACLHQLPRDGARGTRTPDLLGAIQALSQLSYSPVWRVIAPRTVHGSRRERLPGLERMSHVGPGRGARG